MLNVMLGAWSSGALSAWSGFGFGFPAQQTPTRASGKFITGHFQSGLKTLRYKLYIPSSYLGEAMPLLVMLHGCGQDADDFALGTGMNQLAEDARCLVLYPEQSSDANWNRCWHWHHQSHHQRGDGEPAFIAALSKQVIAEYAVDPKRVWVAGLSAGGAMAVILGRTYPDLFGAVGCHSGLAHGSATDGYGAMLAMKNGVDVAGLEATAALDTCAMIVFHGDMDATVHHNNGAAVVQQSLAAYACGMALSEETGEISGRNFTRSIHRSETGKAVAEQWTVHGMGHAWSGGNSRGSYTDSNGPNAGREMLSFFMDL
jgi:poly(hydroxyalkanoate) depolymerase family esterase